MIVHYLEGTFLRNGDLRPPPQARDPYVKREEGTISEGEALEGTVDKGAKEMQVAYYR